MRINGKTAKTYDELIKSIETKNFDMVVIFNRNNTDSKTLYTERYVNVLESKIKELQETLYKIDEYIKATECKMCIGRDEFSCELKYSDLVVYTARLKEMLKKAGVE